MAAQVIISQTLLINQCNMFASTQVLSESVSKALTLRGGEATAETARFLLIIDNFFDCTNVKNYSAGVKSRKPFQLLYRSASDERLKVCLIDYHPLTHTQCDTCTVKSPLYFSIFMFSFIVVERCVPGLARRVGEVSK